MKVSLNSLYRRKVGLRRKYQINVQGEGYLDKKRKETHVGKFNDVNLHTKR